MVKPPCEITSVPPEPDKLAHAKLLMLAHPPLFNSMTISIPIEPTPVISTAFEVAVNLYHTSSFAFPPHAVAGVESVAFSTVPEVFTHETPGVNEMAPAQLSLRGGLGM